MEFTLQTLVAAILVVVVVLIIIAVVSGWGQQSGSAIESFMGWIRGLVGQAPPIKPP